MSAKKRKMNDNKVWRKKGKVGLELGVGIGTGGVRVSAIDLVDTV